MFPRKIKIVFVLVVGATCLCSTGFRFASAQQTKRPFTITDDIGITSFHTVGRTQVKIQFSPDGNYFAVYAERERLDVNRVEDSLRFYRNQDVEDFVKHSDASQPPLPVWVVNRSDMEGPVINDWRWLVDSSGVAFLEGGGDFGPKRLVLADLRKKKVEILTSATEPVEDFDVRDRRHYVYTVADPAPLQKLREEHQAPAMVGTGRSIFQLLLPDDPELKYDLLPRSYLWAVVGTRHFEVKTNGAPVVIPLEGFGLALSPDGESLIAQLVVPEVPPSWEELYPPPALSTSPNRIRAWRQDPTSDYNSVCQYVRIHLQTGAVQSLTDAPVSSSAGWSALGTPSWSSDGEAVLLPHTFLHSEDQLPSSPCVAVVDLSSNTRSCVETLTGRAEPSVEGSHHLVTGAWFIGGDRHRVMVNFSARPDHQVGNIEYRSMAGDRWQVVGQSKGQSQVAPNGLEIEVNEAFDRPPTLVAKEKQLSRVIWDPNPQLNDIDLVRPSVYKWKDAEGRDRRGGLYKPSSYKLGQRYPLVIQTHGFVESEFRPSGLFPTAFAAPELAAAGIMVLQVADEDCVTSKPDEGLCAVSAYEAAARQLISEGLVDPERIGVIGFSRTCFYVMEALTFGSLQLKAASITDGIMAGYSEYLFFDRLSKELDSLMGARPFGEGLQQWLKRSPGFNLDKVTAPLLVVGTGSRSLLWMWQPYAGLRYLQKPVDLIILDTDEHVLTNPAVRMESQGGTVDWFRFWLKDEEDPDPAKAEQYKRWHELRTLQEESDKAK
jgi:dipeptidyl aminopeptidase/acylaminoacyl peptidase